MYSKIEVPRIVVPYLTLNRLSRQILENQYGFSPDYIQVDKLYGYNNILKEIWERKETTIIIEHDVLPWPGAIEELAMCQCEWGTYSYITNGSLGVSHMLGCAKITAALIEKLPGIWDNAREWWVLDTALYREGAEVGCEPHLHRPGVIHINQRELGAT